LSRGPCRHRCDDRSGKDAIKERERQQAVAQSNQNVLRDFARDAFESRKAELKRYGKAGQWFSPLQLHVLTKLGKMPASEIDQRDLRDIVSPIRHDKADTTWQAVNRLSIVMRYAAALGLEVDPKAS